MPLGRHSALVGTQNCQIYNPHTCLKQSNFSKHHLGVKYLACTQLNDSKSFWKKPGPARPLQQWSTACVECEPPPRIWARAALAVKHLAVRVSSEVLSIRSPLGASSLETSSVLLERSEEPPILLIRMSSTAHEYLAISNHFTVLKLFNNVHSWNFMGR